MTVSESDLVRNPSHAIVATYRRRVRASLERVWENVRDWEHLPWLHARAFAAIRCKAAGGWGWRAEVRYPGGNAKSDIELRIDDDAQRYVTRVLTGPGGASEIWTHVSRQNADETDITVEFCRPLAAGEDRAAIAKGYVSLYTQLWDEDEAMMQQRQRELDRHRLHTGAGDPIDLGTIESVRARLPLDVEAFGTRVRVVEHEGAWETQGLVCPHWLGPLEDAALEEDVVVCPWHGYRFDRATGRSCDGRRMRIANPARVAIDVDRDRVQLVRR